MTILLIENINDAISELQLQQLRLKPLRLFSKLRGRKQ